MEQNRSMESLINKLLMAREDRVSLQDELRNKYKKSILTLRINYPGIYKDNENTRGIIKIINIEIDKIFTGKICTTEKFSRGEGPVIIYVIDENPLTIKEKTIALEEGHELGRFADIDVYREDGTSISRKELGYKVRKCFLCNQDAQICVRQKSHREEDIISYIEASYRNFP